MLLVGSPEELTAENLLPGADIKPFLPETTGYGAAHSSENAGADTNRAEAESLMAPCGEPAPLHLPDSGISLKKVVDEYENRAYYGRARKVLAG